MHLHVKPCSQADQTDYHTGNTRTEIHTSNSHSATNKTNAKNGVSKGGPT